MIQINRSAVQDGFTFSLHPLSERELKRKMPNVHPLPHIFIALDRAYDFQTDRGDLYDQIVQLLTRLNEQELADLGGFEVLDPVTEQRVFPAAND